MSFQVGEKVVYPNQGVGIIEQISTRNLTGQPEVFYLLKLSSSAMRVMVPTTNVQMIGLRRVSKSSEIGGVLDFLIKGRCKSAGDWKWRFKENSEKMRNGSLLQVAEVFKSLLTLNRDKPLSFREKKMLDRAWQLLVDEITVARGISREQGEELLAKALSKTNLRAPLPS